MNFSSIESERRWVLTMEKMHIVNIESHTQSCCVWRVPNRIKEEKAEAYAPQKKGLGPYHHKNQHHIHNVNMNMEEVVRRLIQMEKMIRGSYDNYLDYNIETLGWILAIDGLYLLQYLEDYKESRVKNNLTEAGDVLMVENQLPAFVLKKLILCPADESEIVEEKEIELASFLQDQSPLPCLPTATMEGVHLLATLHSSIVHCQFDPLAAARHRARAEIYAFTAAEIHTNHVEAAIEFIKQQGCARLQILTFLLRLPWELITSLFKKQGVGDDGNLTKKKIDMPCISKMMKDAGIKALCSDRGVVSVKYVGQSKELRLPHIKINPNSEVVLRNLVAYEELSPSGLGLIAQYLNLMCGIIHTSKDVKILRRNNIISSPMNDQEICDIFNGITKSETKQDGSNVAEAIQNVNDAYNASSMVKVKASLKMSFNVFFKVLGLLLTIFMIVVLTIQAYCTDFGCSSWFNKKN